MSWWRKLLGLCDHKWDTINQMKIYKDPARNTNAVGFIYHQRCRVCGKMKRVQLV